MDVVQQEHQKQIASHEKVLAEEKTKVGVGDGQPGYTVYVFESPKGACV